MVIQAGELYAGYASDESLRKFSASGGIVSTLLVHLLDQKLVDGVLASRITSIDGHVRGVTSLVRNSAEISNFAGSAYVDTPVLQMVNEIKKLPGRFAVVALPCQVRMLKTRMDSDPELRRKLFMVIGLFCRGNVREQFYDNFLHKFGIPVEDVESVRVSRSYVKGMVTVGLRNGKNVALPFMRMNAYRLAGVDAKALCAWCDEHTSEDADLAVGDIFSGEFKHKPIKHSAFIPHTHEAASLLQDLQERGIIHTTAVGLEYYRKTFMRIEQYSDQLVSRYPAAKIVGLAVPKQQKKGKVNIFHSLAWMIYFFNSRLSQTKSGRKVLFTAPSFLFLIQAYLIKGLSRL
jgi:coenzyme F420-reducing hydrogenase beta subunit